MQFGAWTVRWDSDVTDDFKQRQTTCGTPLYMSPEGVANHLRQSGGRTGGGPPVPEAASLSLHEPGLPVDWWMLGVLTYEMMVRCARN